MSIVLVGSTSGSVTLQEPAVAGTTVLDLPAVSGTILTTTSPKAGNVIQVVQGTYSTETATTSTSFIDTNLSVSITPSSSSSKILIIAIHGDAAAGASANGYKLALLRGSTQIGNRFAQNQMYGATAGAGFNIGASQTIVYLDSPATTSSTTYKTQFRSENGSNVVLFRDNSQGVIIAMEIAA